MGMGASALNPRATVHEFDLGNKGKHNVATYLRNHFNGRFVPHWGDSTREIPENPLKCDELIYVDALHPAGVICATSHLMRCIASTLEAPVCKTNC